MSEWVSVEDRLPDNEDIVYCYGYSMEVDGGNKTMMFGDGALCLDIDEPEVFFGVGIHMDRYVTHWMQPKPPEAE